jgi:hypothetical protein
MHANRRWPILAGGFEKPPGLIFLIFLHIVICCVSLVYVAAVNPPAFFNPAAFHIFYDPARLLGAVAIIAAFAVVSLVFSVARFSLGYFVGFYLYTMILGYLWINFFSDSNYNHLLAGLSAAISAVAFLLPAVLISSPIRQICPLPPRAFGRLLTFIVSFVIVTVVFAAIYNFRFVAIVNIYEFREKIEFPTFVLYSLGTASSVLLPFAFACFLEHRNYWRAGGMLLLGMLFYPVTLSKLALFMPAWLVLLTLLERVFRARTTVILSLFLPTLTGIFASDLWPSYFYVVNFRTMAIPSDAMEIYNQYFANHDLTLFCQIWILKPLMSCPYQSQLSVAMDRAYHLGNFNASLFATEGIASVGLWLAPVAVLFCGLVIGLGNRLSAGLPPRFVLVSGAVVPQLLLNVPLSTVLLTHGLGLLFLLWYLTPRGIFQPIPPDE